MNYQIPKLQSFRVSKFQSFKLPRFQHFRVSKFQSFRITNFQIPHFFKNLGTCLCQRYRCLRGCNSDISKINSVSYDLGFPGIFQNNSVYSNSKIRVPKASPNQKIINIEVLGIESFKFGFDRCPVEQNNAISIWEILCQDISLKEWPNKCLKCDSPYFRVKQHAGRVFVRTVVML